MRAMTFAVSPSKVLIPRAPSTPASSLMNLVFNIPSTSIPHKISTLSCFNQRVPKSVETTAASSRLQPASTPKRVPARDKVIDFGKHKGKMLGSVPSDYLKWMSKKLRAGDTLEWARLADEVLSDPVYRDRIEWEFAENILTGNKIRADSAHVNAATALLEVGERFGWDWEYLFFNGGWGKMNFDLLGTSYGERLPRLGAERNVEVGSSLKKEKKVEKVKAVEEDGGRRSERRERLRQQRMKMSSLSGIGMAKVEDLGRKQEMNDEGEEKQEERRQRLRQQRMKTSSLSGRGMVKVEDLGKIQEMNDKEEEKEEEGGVNSVVGRSPFPGREALLKKVLNRRRV